MGDAALLLQERERERDYVVVSRQFLTAPSQ